MGFDHFKDIVLLAICTGALKELREMQKSISSLNEKMAKLLQSQFDLRKSHDKLEKRVDRMEEISTFLTQ